MEYLHFTFDGISSENYNLIIQNRSEDLSFPSAPEFENQLVSPLYQGTNYLTGVNIKPRVFSFNLWADSLSRKQIIDMQNWLSVGKVANLILDYNPDFQYKVKLDSRSPLKHLPLNYNGTTNYEFTLSFITIEDFAATSIATYSSITGTSADGFEVGYVNGSPSEVFFYNFYNLPFYMIFNIDADNGFTISKNNTVHYQYPLTVESTINSKHGYCLSSGELIEKLLDENDVYVNRGPLEMEPVFEYIYGTVTTGVVDFDRVFNNHDRLLCVENQIVYTSANVNNSIADNIWENGDVVLFKLVQATKLTLTTGVTGSITYSFKYRDNF